MIRRLRWLKQFAITATLISVSQGSYAEKASLCPAPEVIVWPQQPTTTTGDETEISADRSKIHKDGGSSFVGNVLLERPGIRITADRADYDKSEGNVRLSGEVTGISENLRIHARGADLDIDKDESSFSGVDFKMRNIELRGTAARYLSDGSNLSILQDASITSCPPEDVDWSLDAESIVIDHQDEYGSATDTTLYFQDIPIFYLPYLEFPVGDKRRSGILTPELENSSTRGVELAVPWYWNIAPDMDATLTPRYMKKRGAALGTEFRFITTDTSGDLEATHIFDDSAENQKRHFLRYRQDSELSERTTLLIDFNDVSDIRFSNDYSNLIENNRKTYLDRELSITHSRETWQLAATAHSSETISETLSLTNRPYRRLPVVTFDMDQPITEGGLDFILHSEAVSFEHEDDTKLTGTRTIVNPGLRYQLSGDAWYFTPSASIHQTTYNIQDGNGIPIDTEARTLTTIGIETGLIFERSIGDSLLQTLEPKLYYLRRPYEDQSTLPRFDTSLNTFRYAQLFSDNRFSGGDRLSDADQLTFAVESTIYDIDDGRELFKAGIGQIMYFDDRYVNLSGSNVDTEDASDVIAFIGVKSEKFVTDAELQWDIESDRAEREHLGISYKPDRNELLNLSYRMTRNPNTMALRTRHIDVSMMRSITDNIKLIGQWNYSLKDERDLSVIAGFTYESCCWSLGVIGQRQLSNDDADREYDTSVMLQLAFKEFGSIAGNRVANTLRDNIPGYIEETR